ncbi:vanadium-dependent haloperoxidase [Pleomorphovibrio marinus]|uniref:vanadium-dependent haloperoxidase n=1 Tax=Pleomorphovibrio marinus TaxID=2164132 RepID=UPI001E3CBD18|nr:vanadium-dependent haloperoxidase [Pleomorphovibrio marinus]
MNNKAKTPIPVKDQIMCLFVKRRIPAFACFLVLACFLSCQNQQEQAQITFKHDYEIAMLWGEMALDLTQHTPGNSPTFASRAFGYFGLTMYESVVHGNEHKRSLASQLNGLEQLPSPERNTSYNWKISLNAGQAFILKNIYQQASEEYVYKIDSLCELVLHSLSKDEEREVIERSVDFGQRIANSIFEWSMDDGGHRGYLKNFDTNMQQKAGQGHWRPPFFAQTISRLPLHPYWGENRTFLSANAEWAVPAFLPYDTLVESDYYQTFYEVYESNTQLTQEEKEIAMWWNDDPTDTFTPPGHSYYLVNLVLEQKKPDLVTAAETYARVGMAVADAFTVCWRMKYHYYSERPSTYVFENIDDEWEPFWPDPPFPAFPSGHATQAGAVATVFAGLYGDEISFVDNAHSGRKRDKLRNVDYKERSFNSFWEVAVETAYSRFLGGIHAQIDNEVGLEEGRKVGNHINALKWDK